MRKPRVVWFSDTMWAMVERNAEAHGLSKSEWLQALSVTDAFEEQERPDHPMHGVPGD